MFATIRKGVAVLAVLGLAASVSAYIGSYVGLTMDALIRVAIVLHAGIFVLQLPMYPRKFASLKSGKFSLKALTKELPYWAVSAVRLFGIFFAIHFLMFLIESHAASPQIRNGEYVLVGRGLQIIITQREYLHLKGAELRLFATGWMFFYSTLAAYWWFPRFNEPLSGNAPPATSTGRLSQ
jgi:hypothetical protein